MRQQFGFLLLVIGFFILLEIYAFQGLALLFKNTSGYKWFTGVYIITILFGIYGFYKLLGDWQNGVLNKTLASNLLSGFAMSLLAGKLVLCTLLGIQDISRFLIGAFQYLFQFFSQNSISNDVLPGRRNFLTLTAAGLAGIPFLSMIYGITKGKYQYTVNTIRLAFKDLPKNFEGFRIAQISDVHAGSFDSIEKVKQGLQKLMEQKPDLIAFTGDLVNSHKDEINPFIELFQSISAPYGKFAILGNHDYYGSFEIKNETEKKMYWTDFYSKFDEMGFRLLNNNHSHIHIEKEKICIAGVENWGQGRWFPKFGDLNKSLQGSSSDHFTILLSHDPSHWAEKVLHHSRKIQLTLSGHTHGMQFGINIPGFAWSPVKYKYKHWMGLYEEDGKYLYVNRGFGFIGFPGRVGMWPEITVFELRSVAT